MTKTEDEMSSRNVEVDECLKISSIASALSNKVYNLIREVGYGKLSADNALHQMVEVCHDLDKISESATALADILGEVLEETK